MDVQKEATAPADFSPWDAWGGDSRRMAAGTMAAKPPQHAQCRSGGVASGTASSSAVRVGNPANVDSH
jgi:hypothetical protein